MTRIVSRMVIVAMLLAALTVCVADTGTSAAGEEGIIEVKFGTVHAETSPLHRAALKFAEELERRGQGKIKITIFPNSQLGSERDLANSVLMGSLEGAMLVDSVINSVDNVPAANIGSVPFLFPDANALYGAMASGLREELDAQYDAIGLRNVSYIHLGGNDVANSQRPIITPDDMRGLKIRIWDNTGIYNYLDACGASPIPMSFGEVYTAIQQGTIDGVSTNSFQYIPMRFVEVCKYHTDLRVMLNVHSFSFNKEWFEALPADVQKVFTEAGDALYDYCRDVICPESNASDYASIEAAGVEVVRLTKEQRQKFIDIGATQWNDFRDVIGPELFDRIVAITQGK